MFLDPFVRLCTVMSGKIAKCDKKMNFKQIITKVKQIWFKTINPVDLKFSYGAKNGCENIIITLIGAKIQKTKCQDFLLP